MNEFSKSEGGDLVSGVDHFSVLRKQVLCERTLPDSWRARPSTILNEDCGWIVGHPRRATRPVRAQPQPGGYSSWVGRLPATQAQGAFEPQKM